MFAFTLLEILIHELCGNRRSISLDVFKIETTYGVSSLFGIGLMRGYFYLDLCYCHII